MKLKAVVGLILIVLAVCTFDASAAQANGPAPAFDPALAQIKQQVKIPILLPSKLPADMRGSKVVTEGTATDTGYQISLYYEEICNPCFAASFIASTKDDGELPKTRTVQLKNGIRARFLPVRCGGSCAPANLWWEQGGVRYQIQLNLGSTMSVRKQKRAMLELANSLVPAPNGGK